MKLWNWGLVLLASGLFLVPASYFTIISTDLPTAARTVLFVLWLLGVVLVPIGFLLLLISALRGPGQRPSPGPHGEHQTSGTPEHTGVILILVGLVLAPISFLVVTAGSFARWIELLAYVLCGLGVLAVPVGGMMFIYGVRNREEALEASIAAAAGEHTPVATPRASADEELVAKLTALREAGVLTDEEYQAKRSALHQQNH